MIPYQYQASTPDGALVGGNIDATSPGEATLAIVDRGLFPIEITPTLREQAVPRPVSRRDLATVFRSMATLVSAGVPLGRAIAATESLAGEPLLGVLQAARKGLHEGLSLSHALGDGDVIPLLILQILRAGEHGGRLGMALEEAATHLDREVEMRGMVRQALAYPLLLAVVGTVTVVILSAVVVPRFAELLTDAGLDLPTSTRLLLSTSQAVSLHPVLLGITFIVLAAGIADLLQRPRPRMAVERLMLEMPVIGSLRHSLATARFCRALGSTLEAGLPLLPALDAARLSAGNPAVAERIARARDLVAQGASLQASFHTERVLTPQAIQLIAVGEGSGRLGPLAQRAGEASGREAERRLKTVVSLLEPTLIVGFGGLVAFVAAALLQAVYSLRP